MAGIPSSSRQNIQAAAQKRVYKAEASGDSLAYLKAHNNMVTVIDGLNNSHNRNLSAAQFGK